MNLLVALLLLTTAPPENRTEWMRPESFHLAIGMPRQEVMSALGAWEPKPGKHPNEMVIDYSEEKALTLEFRKDRLRSIRFELFVVLPEIRKAFDETRAYLLQSRGEPRKSTKSVLIYDNVLPNVMVVVADDPKSEHGKQGLGVLAVRYYDPR